MKNKIKNEPNFSPWYLYDTKALRKNGSVGFVKSLMQNNDALTNVWKYTRALSSERSSVVQVQVTEIMISSLLTKIVSHKIYLEIYFDKK